MAVELHQFYKERVIPALQAKHGYTNVHQVPRVEKVVVNTCVNANTDVKQGLEDAKAEIALITGPEASGDPLEEEHREFQAAPTPANWREGDAARTAHV